MRTATGPGGRSGPLRLDLAGTYCSGNPMRVGGAGSGDLLHPACLGRAAPSSPGRCTWCHVLAHYVGAGTQPPSTRPAGASYVRVCLHCRSTPSVRRSRPTSPWQALMAGIRRRRGPAGSLARRRPSRCSAQQQRRAAAAAGGLGCQRQLRSRLAPGIPTQWAPVQQEQRPSRCASQGCKARANCAVPFGWGMQECCCSAQP